MIMKPGNVNLESKLQGVEYNTCLVITSAIQWTV